MRIAAEQHYEVESREFAKAIGAELASLLTQALSLSDHDPKAKWAVRVMFEADKL